MSQEQELPAFEDTRVQKVYAILCDDVTSPSDLDEHWEGFVARRIVSALASPPEGGVVPVAAREAFEKWYEETFSAPPQWLDGAKCYANINVQNMADAYFAALTSPPAAASEAVAWQPIETAPKDGTTVDLFGYIDYDQMEMRLCECEFENGEWTQFFDGTNRNVESYLGFHPTHWMPPPKDPAPLSGATHV